MLFAGLIFQEYSDTVKMPRVQGTGLRESCGKVVVH
jgi:hypothetical protein